MRRDKTEGPTVCVYFSFLYIQRHGLTIHVSHTHAQRRPLNIIQSRKQKGRVGIFIFHVCPWLVITLILFNVKIHRNRIYRQNANATRHGYFCCSCYFDNKIRKKEEIMSITYHLFAHANKPLAIFFHLCQYWMWFFSNKRCFW